MRLYIGEADDVWARLQSHGNKDSWTSVVVFVSNDLNLTKAHVRWLEAKLGVPATITRSPAFNPIRLNSR